MRKILKCIGFIFFIFILYKSCLLYISGSKLPDISYKNFFSKSCVSVTLPIKKTLIIFFTTECGPCDDVGIAVYKFSQEQKDFNFIFVTEETDIFKVNNYLDRNNIKDVTSSVFIDVWVFRSKLYTPFRFKLNR